MSRYTEPRNSFCLQMSDAKLHFFSQINGITSIFLTFIANKQKKSGKNSTFLSIFSIYVDRKHQAQKPTSNYFIAFILVNLSHPLAFL